MCGILLIAFSGCVGDACFDKSAAMIKRNELYFLISSTSLHPATKRDIKKKYEKDMQELVDQADRLPRKLVITRLKRTFLCIFLLLFPKFRLSSFFACALLYAHGVGVKVPHTITLHCNGNIEEVLPKVTFPVIIKP